MRPPGFVSSLAIDATDSAAKRHLHANVMRIGARAVCNADAGLTSDVAVKPGIARRTPTRAGRAGPHAMPRLPMSQSPFPDPATHLPDQDLAGLVVVSLEQAVAAPYAASRLADAGARVIKVERPEGDFARRYDSYVNGESAYFVWLNRGKESIALDLRDAEDKALLGRMLERADIFIQNLAPGAVSRLGFDPQALRGGQSGTDHLLDLGLWRRGPLSRSQGL